MYVDELILSKVLSLLDMGTDSEGKVIQGYIYMNLEWRS